MIPARRTVQGTHRTYFRRNWSYEYQAPYQVAELCPPGRQVRTQERSWVWNLKLFLNVRHTNYQNSHMLTHK